MTYVNKTREDIIEGLLKALEEEQLPWHKPWKHDYRNPFGDYNHVSGNYYQGVNRVRLEMAALEEGYSSNEWLTYNQLKDKGYHFLQDEEGNSLAKGKGVPIEIIKYYDKENHKHITAKEFFEIMYGDDEERKEEVYAFYKNYYVFNGDLVQEIVEKNKDKMPIIINEDIKHGRIHLFDDAEKVLDKYCEVENIKVSESSRSRAFYAVKADQIALPNRGNFYNQESFIATKAHEIIHSTGHESRLNRNLNGNCNIAKEELIAEIGATLLCADIGLPSSDFVFNNHKAYIQSWIEILKDKPNELFNAINKADKACSFVKEKGDYEKVKKQEIENTITPVHKIEAILTEENKSLASSHAENEIKDSILSFDMTYKTTGNKHKIERIKTTRKYTADRKKMIDEEIEKEFTSAPFMINELQKLEQQNIEVIKNERCLELEKLYEEKIEKSFETKKIEKGRAL